MRAETFRNLPKTSENYQIVRCWALKNGYCERYMPMTSLSDEYLQECLDEFFAGVDGKGYRFENPKGA